MKGFNLRNFRLMLLIVVLLWSSNVDMSSARRSRHWRHKRPLSSTSLLKKKGKSHGSHNSHNQHHSSKPKTKAPYYKAPSLPTPSPTPVVATPPAYKGSPPKAKSPKAPSLPTPSPTPVVVMPPAKKAPYYKGSPPKPKSPPCPSPIVDTPSPNNVFSVLDYGARGDGSSDDTKAFEAAWGAACKVQSSTMLIPSGYKFLMGPISFSGPYCQKDIVFQVDGTIIAPTNPAAWSPDLMWWMDFTKLVGITIQGKGTIDGSGSVWWKDAPHETPWDDETQMIIPLNDTMLESPPMPVGSRLSGMPSIRPTAVRFYGSFNVTVTGITIQNSPQCHLKFDNCIGVTVYSMTVSSPGDSPNTDGIHLQNSNDVLIHSSSLACGKDTAPTCSSSYHFFSPKPIRRVVS